MKISENQKQFQKYLDSELEKYESVIDNIVRFWLIDSHSSEMVFKNKDGQIVINSSKAFEHFKIVEIYNFIYKTSQFTSYSRNKNTKRLSPIELKNKEEDINIILKELGLNYCLDELRKDFNGSRKIIKSLFQKKFSKYEIQLSDVVVDRLFSKITFDDDTRSDLIQFFCSNDFYRNDLGRQFHIYDGSRKAAGIFSAFFMRAAGLLENYSNERISTSPIQATKTMEGNPFYQEKNVLRAIAKIQISCMSNYNILIHNYGTLS